MSSLNSTRQRLQVSFGFVSFGFVVLCMSWVVYQAPPLFWAASEAGRLDMLPIG
jgi:hypothetical protein